MAAPTIPINSIVTIEAGSSTTGSASPTLSAAGNDRIVVIAFCYKDNSATAAVPSAVVVDSAGVNASIANGKVVRQGSLQIAQNGNDSVTVDVYFCLEANLPTSSGAYVVDTTLDSAPSEHLVIIFEVNGCPDQAYDNIVQGSSTTTVTANTTFGQSITPTVNDCLIVSVFGLGYFGPAFVSASQTLVTVIDGITGGAISSEFTQTTAASKAMEYTSDADTTEHAFTLFSFSGAASPAGGIEILRRRIEQ